MNTIRLGKTEIITNKNGFGALPIQRVSFEEAGALLMRAYEAGVTFFDTARFYTDSEKKIGASLVAAGLRDKIFIATKTMCKTTEEFWSQLETSLNDLDTDYIDLYQFHNPLFCPKPGDGTGLYEAMLEAKAQGKIKHIGITSHRIVVAEEAIESGLYETLQFPLCYLSSDNDVELVRKCKEADMGFIAMKAMSGGLIVNGRLAYAYLNQFDNVLPIWGVQRSAELEEFLACEDDTPVLDDAAWDEINKDREELLGEFCRGCGYCMPCPVGIEINNCARMSLMIRRAPIDVYMGVEYQSKMEQIEDCINCGACKSKCPYELDTPELLRRNLEDYRQQLKIVK